MLTNSHLPTRPVTLVGGGTGGHITPLIAVGEELKTKKTPFIVIGGHKSREQQMFTELGWAFYPIQEGKWRRDLSVTNIVHNLIDILRTVVGFFQAIKILVTTGSSVVFSKGGHVSVPVVYASRLLGRPVIIHESDAVMGLSNRLASRFAARVLTAFAPNHFSWADNRFTQVGIPIRQALRQAAKLKGPRKNRPLLFIICASQGSSVINSLVRQCLPELLKLADVVHLTGEKEFELHKKFADELPAKIRSSYRPFSFITRELPYYFQTADVVVGRASATTLAEGALFGKAMYVIPLPWAAANHQVTNARILEKEGAVVVDEQSTLTAAKFLTQITNLLQSPDKQKKLGDNLRAYFNEDHSLSLIIDELNRISHKPKNG